jgi:hypothetical protein
MDRFLLFLLLVPNVVAEPRAEAIKSSICEVTETPARFTGKMVILRGQIITPRRLFIEDGCGRVILDYPGGEDVRPKAQFKLIEDEEFKRMNNALGVLVPMPPRGPGRVVVEVEGRFDSAFIERRGRKVQLDPNKIHLPVYELRLILHRVLNVEITPGK